MDSSELAFKLASIYAFRQVLLHPAFKLEVFFSIFSGGIGRSSISWVLPLFSLAWILTFPNFMEQCYAAARPVILEPVMFVELKVPMEFQGAVAGDINK